MNRRGRIIGEFLLIVAGVLVALAVETALDERQDDKLGDQYISRIETDIAADKKGIEYRIEFFTAVGEFSQEFSNWIESDAPFDKDVLLASFYAAEVWPFVPNASTYLDLQSTGNIRLVDDIDFRTSLVTYHVKADASRPGWSPSDEYRRSIRGIIPANVQELIRENCPTTDERDEKLSGFQPCELPGVDYARLGALYEPLRSDVSFRRTLTYRNSELSVMIRLLRQQSLIAGDILARIEAQRAK